ncbi:MAG: HNH endonuclease [Muribaculaceae bacterium]|nr:HNH endonuclease [Muribaculaceae bacterium]
MAKDEDYNRLIRTAQWRRLRKAVLTAHPLCQRCSEEGRISAACEVHHVCPVEEALTYGEKSQLMFDPHNLRALCHDCHVRTHTEMGRSGKEASKERNGKHVARFIDKFF